MTIPNLPITRIARVCLLSCLFAFAFSAWAQNVSVEVMPRWPWNGKVDITVTNHGYTPVILSDFQGYDKDHDQELALRTISYDGERFVATNELRVAVEARNSCKIVWDAAADYPTLRTSAFAVKATAARCYKYLVVNLTNGSVRFTDNYSNGNGDTWRTTELWLRWVPAGTFTMGSPSNELGQSSNETQHQVTLTQGYYIGVFEVTQRQYELVMGVSPSKYKGDTRPVENVSYNDIRGTGLGASWPSGGHAVGYGSFLATLRAKTGLEFDLPTEAQWEYACRAGTTAALNSGKNLTQTGECPNMAEVGRYWYNRSDGKGRYGEHTRVGSYLPNAWELYDMHGNVEEWCLDWDGDYPSKAVVDPLGADAGAYRVLRGGHYYSDALDCRSAHRNINIYSPADRGTGNGFRLVCPP